MKYHWKNLVLQFLINVKKAEILSNTLDELLGEEPPQINAQQKQEIEEVKQQLSDEGINSRFTIK